MKFSIRNKIFEDFSGFTVGAVIVKAMDNHGASGEIADLLRKAEVTAREEFTKLESVGQHPHIAAWRQAYKKFGSDPHQYRSSVEALVRRVLKGDSIPHINRLVDLYNYISLKYIIPAGGEDSDAIKGDLILDLAEGGEPFIRLGGVENEPPDSGEVVYKDEAGIICRRWNWREAERTKLTEDTRNAVIVLEGLPPVSGAIIQQAGQELVELIQERCGGQVSSAILGESNSEVEIK